MVEEVAEVEEEAVVQLHDVHRHHLLLLLFCRLAVKVAVEARRVPALRGVVAV